MPVLLLGALSGVAWTIAALAACIVVLMPYSFRLRSPLGVLITLVLVGFVEFVVQLGAAATRACGDSGVANDLKWSGSAVILIALGGFGVYRRRLFPVLVALVAAGAWVAIVAHIVPGGTGGCFE